MSGSHADILLRSISCSLVFKVCKKMKFQSLNSLLLLLTFILQYTATDTAHTGTPGPSVIRYAYTSDFRTFTAPETFISAGTTPIIDLSILPLGGTSYVRFLKNESATNVYMERSDTGLFGTWTRPGGATAIIRSSVEGPASDLDNQVAGKAHLLLDYYGSDGYRPFESTDLSSQTWTDSNRTNFPSNRRHGSVIGIDQVAYTALNAKWG
jgi:hypothetical protein